MSSEKTDKYEYLTGGEILPSDRWQIIEQAKLIYSPLRKALEKQIEKQVGALKYIDLPNKNDEFKQIERIFSHKMMNDLLRVKLK